MNNIFCERQRGDLCRMHSINNYFGISKINEKDFYEYCDKYDKLIEGLESRNMDGFAEGRSIVSYIMDVLARKFILLIPYDSYISSRQHLDMNFYNKIFNKVNCFFEFNKNHIWINKKINNKMFKIDSLGGVYEINNKRMGNNGYFLVIDDFLLYEHVEYFINNLKLKLEKQEENENFEIIFYNLYYCLKHVDTNIQNKNEEFLKNSKFVSNLTCLDDLKTNLKLFIEFKRKNKKTEKFETIILNLIKYQDF